MLPQKAPDSYMQERVIIPNTKYHPEQLEEMESEIAPHQKVSMLQYSSAEQGLIKDNYYNYYCTICARMVILTTEPLHKFPLRRTDKA